MLLEVQIAEEEQKTKGKPVKKQTLLLDGELYCRCYRKDLQTVGIKQGEEVTKAQMEQLEEEIFLPRAKRRSLYLLNRKRYTRKEMRKKLKNDGYPETVIEQTLSYLEQLHYVEDDTYAKGYAFYLLQRCSEREAYQKMLQKGFEKEVITEALRDAKETYYLEQGRDGEAEAPEIAAIRSFLRKKGYHAEQTTEEKKKKMMMTLYRKGFSISDIKQVLGETETEYDFE